MVGQNKWNLWARLPDPWARVTMVREKEPNLCIGVAKVIKRQGKNIQKEEKKKNKAWLLSREPKKKAKKSHCSLSKESTTSSSVTCSSESGGSQDVKLAKTERVHVASQGDLNKYDLPAELV